MNARMPLQIGFDDISLMNLVVVPDDNDVASKVPLQIGEKFDHLRLADILVGMELDIEPQALLLGRNTDTTDGRDLIPIPCHLKARGFSPWGPCAPDRWYQQKAAFIDENEMCSKLCGFFLLRPTPDVSNPGWHARFSPWPAVPASGNSIQEPASIARHWQWCSGHESAWRLPPAPVSVSRDRSRSLLPADLPT